MFRSTIALMALLLISSNSGGQILGSNRNARIVCTNQKKLSSLDGTPCALAISPNGQFLAVGRTSGQVELLKLTGTPAVISSMGHFSVPPVTAPASAVTEWFKIYSREVTGLSFVDNSTVLAANGGGRITFYDVTTQTALSSQILPHTISALDVSPGSGRFVIGTENGGIREYSNASTLIRQIRLGRQGEPPVHSLAYLDGASKVFSCLEDYSPQQDKEVNADASLVNAGPVIWDSASGERLAGIKALSGNVVSLEYSGGRLLLTSDHRQTGMVSLLHGCEWTPLNIPLSNNAAVLGALGGKIISVSPHGMALLDPNSDRVLLKTVAARSSSSQLAVEAHPAAPVFVVLTKEDIRLHRVTLFSGEPAAVPISDLLGSHLGYDIEVTHELRCFDEDIEEVCVTDNGNLIAVRGHQGDILLWTRHGNSYRPEMLPVGTGEASKSRQLMSISPWGLLVTTKKGELHDVRWARRIQSRPVPITTGSGTARVLAAVRVSQNTGLVSLEDGSLRTIDLQTGSVGAAAQPPSGGKDRFVRLAVEPLTKRIIALPNRSRNSGLQVTVLDPSATQVVAVTSERWNAPKCTFSGDGKVILCGGGEQGLFYYDVTSSPVLVAQAPGRFKTGAAAFNNELTLASGSLRSTLLLKDAGQGKLSVIHPGRAPSRCLGGAIQDNSVFVGLQSGTVLRIKATAHP